MMVYRGRAGHTLTLHIFGAFLVWCTHGASSADVADAAARFTSPAAATVISQLAPPSITMEPVFSCVATSLPCLAATFPRATSRSSRTVSRSELVYLTIGTPVHAQQN
jgi:hypothetical protein